MYDIQIHIEMHLTCQFVGQHLNEQFNRRLFVLTGSPFNVKVTGEGRIRESITRRQKAASVASVGSVCDLNLKIPGKIHTHLFFGCFLVSVLLLFCVSKWWRIEVEHLQCHGGLVWNPPVLLIIIIWPWTGCEVHDSLSFSWFNVSSLFRCAFICPVSFSFAFTFSQLPKAT